jgi:hypothetical protein
MSMRRFTRLTNGFSKKLDNHVAAVALYVAHYNLCRTHEALRTTPAKALGVADRAWTVAQLVDSVEPYCPDAGDFIWLQFDPQAGREQAGPVDAPQSSCLHENIMSSRVYACFAL